MTNPPSTQVSRYSHPFMGPTTEPEVDYSRLICMDCSTRSTVVTIPADEQADHDVWHEACKIRDEFDALNREVPEALATALDSGAFWTTATLQRDYAVEGFAAPFVVARRKADGVLGSLRFNHMPRVYFGWQADS